MRSCPRSVRPGDTGAPPAQPSEAMPPAPGLAAIATPDRATTLRSWGLLMGSVRGSAGHPAAAVAAGRHRAMFQLPPQHPKTRRESLLPCSRNCLCIWRMPWGPPGHRSRALSSSPKQDGMLSPKLGIFSPKVGVHVLPPAPRASVFHIHPWPRSMRAKAQLDFAHLVHL